MWKLYEPETIERELGYAEMVGFDSVRVCLNYRAWSEAPADFIQNFQHFLDASAQLGLLVNPAMFDGCGVKGADITTQTTIVGARYETLTPLQRDFISRGNGRKYVERYLWDRIIPDLEDNRVLFWEFWAPTPGPSRMGKEHWPAYERYCSDLIQAAENGAILAWDVMNEPPAPENPVVINDHPELSEPFLYHFVDFVQKRARGVPVLVGVARQSFPQVSSRCDKVCFHCYQRQPILQDELKKAKKSAREFRKPLLCNECLSYFLFHERPDEQSQLETIKEQHAAFEKEGIGWMAWHLIEGEMFLPYCGFVRRDGSLKPAAVYLKDQILK
ncbi:MAG: hypothetical protein ISS66_08545 [Desulfobacteraceae bacterium]|nr:hypothetical protein [Desulfobacteraceae bacterium]